MENVQFKMSLSTLDNLPQLQIPEGYELLTYKPGFETEYQEVISETFGGDHSFSEEISGRGDEYSPERCFFIFYNGHAVATATALIKKENDKEYGYLHMVGTLSEHKGKRLGYEVSLACLWAMKEKGMEYCVLNTDDFRIPAIVTYLKLGFLPEMLKENQYERWTKVLEQIGREDLIPYVMQCKVVE